MFIEIKIEKSQDPVGDRMDIFIKSSIKKHLFVRIDDDTENVRPPTGSKKPIRNSLSINI